MIWDRALYNKAKRLEKRARVHKDRKNYDIALDFYKEASEIWKRLNKLRSYKKCIALITECEAKKLRNEKANLQEICKKYFEASTLWSDINNERNANWCIANFHVFRGIDNWFNNKYEEAKLDFKTAKTYFEKIKENKSIKFCEAWFCSIEGRILKNRKDFQEGGQKYFEASNIYKGVSISRRALICEAHGWLCVGLHNKDNYNYEDAILNFQASANLFDSLKMVKQKFWSEAQISECQYFLAKLDGNYDHIIENLHKAIDNFEKTGDEKAILLCKADLARYIGIKYKIGGKLDEAYQSFIKSKEFYVELSKLDPTLTQYLLSINYLDALVGSTEADIDLVSRLTQNNFDLSLTAKKYGNAERSFFQAGDSRSGLFCRRFRLFCTALNKVNEGKFDEARKMLKRLTFPIAIQRSLKSINLPQLITPIINVISKYTKEIIELDKGHSFEARIRELIRLFDNRTIKDKTGKIFGEPRDTPIILHKYESVKREIFKVINDEVGIVFPNKTPIEIDILAERMVGNRKYLLVGECKNRPNRMATKSDIKLLHKKSKFVLYRYEKIAKLNNLYKPLIDYVYYISIGGFDKWAKIEAEKRRIKTIDKDSLNILLKLFKEFPIK